METRSLLSLLLIAVHPLLAEEKASFEPVHYNIVFENDYFVTTDRWYTTGVDLSLLSRIYARPLPFSDKKSLSYIGLSLSLEMYTPEKFNDPEPQPNDRPYAGWLYGSFALHQSSAKCLDSLELQLGIVGPSARAEEIQRFVHDHVIGDPVDGWQNQLRDEPGVNLAYHHHQRYSSRSGGYETVFIPRIGAVLGNVRTEADLGLLYRLGVHLPRDFGQNFVMTPGLDSAIPAINMGEGRKKAPFSCYLQLQSDLRLVARDLFLEGNSYKSSLSVEPYPMVGRVGGGIGGAYGNYQLSLIWTAESRSFTQQHRIHGYGSLLFSYAY